MPAPDCAARNDAVDGLDEDFGGLSDASDLSRSREGEAARLEARECKDAMSRVNIEGQVWIDSLGR